MVERHNEGRANVMTSLERTAQQGHGADCLQRTLLRRSRFRQQLMPGVRGAADKAAHLMR